jgi:hypothetical protein
MDNVTDELSNGTQKWWVFGIDPSFGILRDQKTRRFGNWICFRLQMRWGRTPTQLGPVERANLNHYYFTNDNMTLNYVRLQRYLHEH